MKKNVVKEWGTAIVSALIIAAVVRLFFFAPYEVLGTSMYPTLDGNELLIVNKFIYKVKNPAYGDIIVFHTNEKRDFVKRVIGLPNDRIEIHEGSVFRNGKQLKEEYISEKILGDLDETVVPAGKLFVLGDNRNNSKDSRIIGSVSMNEVVGRADVIVLPLSRIDLLAK
ncbi:signal peptidase I [Seinonella peptonophila]|nr:signal peptidase I [Seinonella peptonophila]